MNIRRKVAEFLYDLADRVDPLFILDVSCDIAMDNDFGYCPDCSPESPYDR
jgi:hypothetical protein